MFYLYHFQGRFLYRSFLITRQIICEIITQIIKIIFLNDYILDSGFAAFLCGTLPGYFLFSDKDLFDLYLLIGGISPFIGDISHCRSF